MKENKETISLNNYKISESRSDMKQDKAWSEKHDELLKKVVLTSGKPMGFKSPDNILKHLESLGNRS